MQEHSASKLVGTKALRLTLYIGQFFMKYLSEKKLSLYNTGLHSEILQPPSCYIGFAKFSYLFGTQTLVKHTTLTNKLEKAGYK